MTITGVAEEDRASTGTGNSTGTGGGTGTGDGTGTGNDNTVDTEAKAGDGAEPPPPLAADTADEVDASQSTRLDTLQSAHLLYETLQEADLPRFSALLARYSGQPGIVDYSHGDGYTCLQFACDHRLSSFVDLLLKARADPAAASPLSGRTALHWAAARDAGILQRLLEHAPGPAVNMQDALQCTPLHHAVQAGNPEAMRALLKAGADVSARDDLGEPLLLSLPVDVLKERLDDCVRSKRDVGDAEFGLEFDYSLMWPRLPKGQTQFEMAAVYHLASSAEHCHLLRHPLVNSFLDLKWWAASGIFVGDLAYYVLFLVLLTTLVLLRVESETYEDFGGVISGFYWATIVVTVPLVVAKVVQFLVAPIRFFFLWENVLLKAPILGMTTAYLSRGARPVIAAGTPDPQLQLAAMVVLFAWAELFTLLSRLPFFAIYAMMYITVFCRFLRFLFWYTIIITGFALGMYIVFKDSEDQSDPSTFWLTMLRTLVMILDKMDINSLPLEHCQKASNGTWLCQSSDGPKAGQIVFVLCIFIVTVVLTNLLNGLAIADTASLRGEAFTFSLVSRTRLLAYTESVLLDGPLQFLGAVPWPLRECGLRRDSALIRCLSVVGDKLEFCAGFARYLGLARRLPKHYLWMFPNRDSDKTYPHLPEYWWFDDEVLDRARSLVLQRDRGQPDLGRQLSRLKSQLDRQLSDMGS